MRKINVTQHGVIADISFLKLELVILQESLQRGFVGFVLDYVEQVPASRDVVSQGFRGFFNDGSGSNDQFDRNVSREIKFASLSHLDNVDFTQWVTGEDTFEIVESIVWIFIGAGTDEGDFKGFLSAWCHEQGIVERLFVTAKNEAVPGGSFTIG